MNSPKKCLTVEEIAKSVNGIVHGNGQREIYRLTFPRHATQDGLAICLEDMNVEEAIYSGAAAVMIPPKLMLPLDRTFITTSLNMREALYRVICLFLQQRLLIKTHETPPALHKTAVLGEAVVIGKGASVGARSILGNHVVLGQGVTVGSDCRIETGAIVHDNVCLGDRVVLHSGVVIGGDGYLFFKDTVGENKIPSIGSVLIQDDVEIWENVTVARGILGNTVIGNGTKIDCQTHIGHDVIIGRDCKICAQCAIAGWAEIQDSVTIYGMSGVTNRAIVGKSAIVQAVSAVTKNVRPGAAVSGNPATEHQKELKVKAFLHRLYKNGKGDKQ